MARCKSQDLSAKRRLSCDPIHWHVRHHADLADKARGNRSVMGGRAGLLLHTATTPVPTPYEYQHRSTTQVAFMANLMKMEAPAANKADIKAAMLKATKAAAHATRAKTQATRAETQATQAETQATQVATQAATQTVRKPEPNYFE